MEAIAGNTVRDVLDVPITDRSGDVFLVNPRESMVRALPDLVQGEEGARFKVLAEESVLKSLRKNFGVATELADLIAVDRLELGEGTTSNRALVVTPSSLTAVIEAGGDVAGLHATDESVVDAVYEDAQAEWEEASEFPLRTPPLSEIRETLAAEMDQSVVDDLETFLESVDDLGSGSGRVHAATACLLVAARHTETLYDISTWGEDVGVASKATFSRQKQTLEELGLLTTEKVPTDFGRPRLRLILASDQLQRADAEEFPDQALSLVQAA